MLNEKEQIINDYLKELFEKHNLKLVDCSQYTNEDDISEILDIPQEREVSYKWLARIIAKNT